MLITILEDEPTGITLWEHVRRFTEDIISGDFTEAELIEKEQTLRLLGLSQEELIRRVYAQLVTLAQFCSCRPSLLEADVAEQEAYHVE